MVRPRTGGRPTRRGITCENEPQRHGGHRVKEHREKCICSLCSFTLCPLCLCGSFVIRPLLQRHHRERPVPQRPARFYRGVGCRQRGDTRDPVLHRRGANAAFIRAAAAAGRRVDHQGHRSVFHQVDQIRPTFLELQYILDRNAMFTQLGGRAAGGNYLIAQRGQRLANADGLGLVAIVDRQEHRADARQRGAGGQLALGERHRHGVVNAHDFAGGPHFRPKDDVYAGEFVERKDAFLDREMCRRDFVLNAEFVECLADHHQRGVLGQRHSGRLGDKRDCARGAGDLLPTQKPSVSGAHQRRGSLNSTNQRADAPRSPVAPRTAHSSARGRRARPPFPASAPDLLDYRRRQAVRRDHARRITTVDARFLDVLHDAADHDAVAVAKAIDVHLDGRFQELVNQDRFAGRHVHRHVPCTS